MPQTLERNWIIAPPQAQRAELAREAGIAPLLAQIMLNRGIRTPAEISAFLAPKFRDLLDPAQLPGAAAAAERLAAAASSKRKIVIYGDYDVDGITASAILWHALRLGGADVDFYVPSRFEEGYGLNGEALARLAADGAQVVVTVDCGITAIGEARRARELGLELIVTDHHTPKSELPDASAIVHPFAIGPSANRDLCGAGVALKLAWAFCRRMCGAERVTPEYRDFLVEATAFAALGLVADVVPLTGENRALAAFGLKQLCHAQNPGLRALLEVSGLSNESRYDDYHVGFVLGPRLNAIGRMGHAQLAVDLFTRAGPERAREIADKLETHNRDRQAVERDIVAQAEQLVRERGYDRDGCRGIVLAERNWHIGVLGIVAARLVDRFRRPAVMISLDNGVGQGSCRSVQHFPLSEVLERCANHLVSFGGHAMAAGVRIKADQVEAFTRAFQAEAAQRLTPQDLSPKLYLDDEVGLDELLLGAVEPLTRMAPFGNGNARPLLATRPVDLVDEPRVVGNGRHLQFAVRDGRTYRKAIAFNRGKQAEELREHSRMRLAFEPILNGWGGTPRVELKVVDWKYEDGPLAAHK